MLKPHISPPSDIDDRIALADWAELTILLSQHKHVGRADIRAAIRLSTNTDDDDVDVATDMLLEEVRRRKKLAPGSYPFTVDSGGISTDESSGRLGYVFLLTLAVSPSLRMESRQAEVEPLFDAVVQDALCEYLGPGSQGVRFGTPADPERPTRFIDALEWLAGHMGYQLGKAAEKPPVKNDGGADVVVWRPFRDKRTAFLSIIAQCTIQLEWREKAKDIVMDLWRGWIDFGKDFTTCLAIPFVLPLGYQKWDEVRRTVVLILDRMRMAELLESRSLSRLPLVKQWLAKELQTLTVGSNKRSKS